MFDSSQISGLVGGQMAMFSNQAQFSQQIGGLYGTGPQMPMGGMQNPFPQPMGPSYGLPPSMQWTQNAGNNWAQNIVGTAGQMLPAAAGIGMMGMSMMPGMGWTDPFTMFRAGVGLPRGAGFMGTMGHVGAAFRTGGLGAGLGTLGGGFAAAAGPAALMYAASKGVEFVGQNIYQGAQNISDVTRMTGYMGPQFGPGARPGGGMGRQTIQGMVGVMHELVGEDAQTTMDSVKRLMDMAGRMGHLIGITNVQQFKDRFGTMVRQVREIAKVMGTTLEEAAPVFGQMRQMGLWSTRDILGTTVAMRAVGPQAAPHMLAAMQTGAQQSWQMGGPMGAGARMARGAFMNVQAAMRTGTISQEQLMEFTGGVGGVEGQRMLAEQMTGTMSRMAESPMGRLMMAGLGEFRGGRFTGQVDQEKMQRFMRGEIGVQELQNIGMSRTGTREGAASWEVRRGQIGQQMMSQGGMTGMAASIEAVMERAGYGGASSDIQNIFIQKLTGLGAREAEAMRKMIEDLPKILADQGRQTERAMADSFRRLEIRRNRSWEGLKDSLAMRLNETFARPIQEYGERLTTRVGETVDEITRRAFGISDVAGMTGAEATQIRMRAGAAAAGAVRPTEFDVTTPLAQRLRTGTTRVETLERMGLQTQRTGGAGTFAVGGGRFAQFEEATAMIGRMERRRVSGGDLEAMGYGVGSTEKKATADKAVSSARQWMINNADKIKELRKSSRTESEFIEKVTDIMDIGTKSTLLAAGRELGGAGGTRETLVDFLTSAQADLPNVTKLDLDRLSQEYEGVGAGPQAYEKGMEDVARKLDAMSGRETQAGVLAGAGAVGILAAGLTGGLSLLATPAAAYFGFGTARKAPTGAEMGTLFTAGIRSEDIEKYLKGEQSAAIEAVFRDQTKGAVAETLTKLKGMKTAGQKIEDIMAVVNQGQGTADVEAWRRAREERVQAAGAVSEERIQSLTGKVSEDTVKQYRELLSAMKGPNQVAANQLAAKMMADISGDTKAQEALAATGAAGQWIAAGARVSGLSEQGQMTERQFTQWSKRQGMASMVEQMKQDPEFARRFKEMATGGFEFGELRELETRMRKYVETAGPGKEATPQEDQELKYKDANTKFVFAVTDSVIKLQGKNEEEIAKLLAAQREAVGQKPTEGGP